MPTRNGWNQHDLLAIFDRRIHALQVFDIVFANEQIYERAQFTAFIEQVRFDGGELIGQVGQCLRYFYAGYLHFAFSAGVGA